MENDPAKFENLFFDLLYTLIAFNVEDVPEEKIKELNSLVTSNARGFEREVFSNIRRINNFDKIDYYKSLKNRISFALETLWKRSECYNQFNQSKFFELKKTILFLFIHADKNNESIENYKYYLMKIDEQLENHLIIKDENKIDVLSFAWLNIDESNYFIDKQNPINDKNQKPKETSFENYFIKPEYVKIFKDHLKAANILNDAGKLIPKYNNINKEIVAIIEILSKKGYCQSKVKDSHRIYFLTELTDESPTDTIRKVVTTITFRNYYDKIIKDLK